MSSVPPSPEPHDRSAARSAASGSLASAGAASVAAHVVLAVVGAALAVAHSLASQEEEAERLRHARLTVPGDLIEIELPSASVASTVGHEEHPMPAPVPLGGGHATAQLDSEKAGRGGDGATPDPAVNLADRIAALNLDRGVFSHLLTSQLQRIDAKTERATRENWRASRDPMKLTFLASGTDGTRPERRPNADRDPGAGVSYALVASVRGGAPGRPQSNDGFGEIKSPQGSSLVGGPTTQPAPGVQDSTSGEANIAAKNALARPFVDRGTPSVPAAKQGKPGDDIDSQQQVASLIQSIVHASTAGGRLGTGRGGDPGPGSPGSGGVTASGFESNAAGDGSGGPPNPARDNGRMTYILDVMRQIPSGWQNSFPKAAALEGHIPTATVRFVVNAAGHVVSADVSRSSGFPSFDQGVRQAVLAGGPYGPLPAALGQTLTIQIPFTVENPAVRPKDPSRWAGAK